MKLRKWVSPNVGRKSVLVLVALGVVLAGASATRATPPSSWSTKTAMTPRVLAMAGVIAGKLYVAGGVPSGGGSTSLFEVYDPTSDAWVRLPDMPTSRASGAAAVIDNKLYVVGGWLNADANSPTGTLEVYDPASDTWSSGTPMPTARGSLVAAAIDGKLYVTGGTGPFSGGDDASLEIYDPGTDTWTTGASLPTPREAAAGVALGGKFYVIGGYNRASATPVTGLVEAYNPSSDSWSAAAAMPTARWDAAAAVLGGMIHVVGGASSSDGNPGLGVHEVYDPSSDSWSNAEPMPTGRLGLVAGATDTELYAVGGETGIGGDILGTNELFSSGPGPVTHFVLSDPSPSAVAGKQSSVTVTAEDAANNPTDVGVSSATLTSNLEGSSTGCGGPPCNVSLQLGSFSNGVATATFTAYKAEDGRTLTVTAGSATGSTSPFTLAAGDAANLTLSAASTTPNAGDADNLTIAAQDAYGNTATTYSGDHSLTFTGASSSPNGNAPTVTDKSGTPVAFGTAETITFTGGSAAGVMKLYKTEAPSIQVGDGSINNNPGLPVSVGPGPFGSFSWTSQPAASQRAGTPIAAAVTAYDTFGNVKTDYALASAKFTGLNDAPNGNPAYQASAGSFVNGVDGGPFVDYKTYDSDAIKVTDTASSMSATSSAFTVLPGDLGSFAWTQEPGTSVTAGATIAATVEAVDKYGNLKTDYAGTGFSGLNASPSGCPSPHPGQAPSYPGFIGGVASGFVDYRTEATHLTIADGSISADSTSFTVNPAGIGGFAWTSQPGTPQVAGQPIVAAVTAYDLYCNVKVDYGSLNGFSGLHDAPNGSHAATYGSWTNGVDNGPFVGYRTEPGSGTAITVRDGTPPATSSSFVVTPSDPGTVTFTQQPSEEQINTAIAPAVKVQVIDIYGNQAFGEQVAMALNPPAGGAGDFTPASTKTVTTDQNGVATFNNLIVGTVAIGYKMTATAKRTPSSGVSLSALSGPFSVAQTVAPCTGSCTGSASQSQNSVSVSANGTSNTNTLGIALLTASSSPPPSGACPNFTPGPGTVGSYVNINNTGTQQRPSETIVWTLDKSIVQLVPNNGAAHYNICLGAVHLPDLSNTAPGWTTKSGTPARAILDPSFGVYSYWGLMPDCVRGVTNNPCVSSRNKTGSGNVVITLSIPYPWDPNFWGG